MLSKCKEWVKDKLARRKEKREEKNGLFYKKESTKRKIEVAMSILDRRKENIPVEIDRRRLQGEAWAGY